MKKSLLILVILAGLIHACVPIAQQSSSSGNYVAKEFRTEDYIYEDQIKTVTLYPYTGEQRDLLRSSSIPISQNTPLQLSFDELSPESKNYYIKIIHCNRDWSPSVVSSIDYIDQFNEILIRDYYLSASTRNPYTHYRVEIPRVKIAGNYLIKVYRNRNEDDLIITRRFMVYSNQVKIDYKVKFSNVVNYRDENQQIDFSIRYENMEIINPTANVRVLLRQNQRWDNAINNLQPMFVREDIRLLEYNYFNLENNFKGGNEFRAFDIRTLNFPGMNVAKINSTPGRKEALLAIDKSRNGLPYSLIPDINGKFVVDNYDFNSDSTSSSDYLDVNFSLQNPQINQEVFIVGALTNWKLNPDYKMTFNPASGRYEGKALLKQGWYNYAYGVKDENGKISTQIFEGSHDDTENQYELFVYYRPVGTRTDLIIGYLNIDYNLRK